MPATAGLHGLPPRLPSRWIDISRPLAEDTPVWPGDQAFRRHQHTADGVTVSSLATTCHAGTHLEGPRHLEADAPGLEALSLKRLIGPAEVVAPHAEAGLISPAGFPPGWSPRAPRLLLRTDSHPPGVPIGPAFVGVAPDAVAWLAEHGVDLLGVDTPSVDPFTSGDLDAHRALAARRMVWLEGLDLSAVEPGLYYLAALALPLVGAEASPARVVLGVWD